MMRVTIVAVLALRGSISVFSQATSQADGIGREAVVIEVVDRASAQPIFGAVVEAIVTRDTRTAAEKKRAAKAEGCPVLPQDTQTWKTDASGQAAVTPNLEKAVLLTIRVVSDGHAAQTMTWRVSGDPWNVSIGRERIRVAMPRAVSISGRVLDEDGKAVAGASIDVIYYSERDGDRPESPHFELHGAAQASDREGRFQIDGLPEGFRPDDLMLRANHAEYLREEAYEGGDNILRASAERKLYDLRVERDRRARATIVGRVMGADGKPIAGARVQQGWEHPDHISFQHARFWIEPIYSDADGRFRIENAVASPLRVRREGEEPTDLLLTVQADGFEPQATAVKIEPDVKPLEFRLSPGKTLRGRVIDAEGRPIEGVEVDASTWRERRALYFRAKTDAEGRFTWNSAPADTIALTMRAAGFMNGGDRMMTASDSESVILMRRAIRVTGVVRDAMTHEPLSGVEIRAGSVYRGDDEYYWSSERIRSKLDGSFEHEFDFEAPGYVFRFETQKHEPLITKTLEGAEQEHRLKVDLNPNSNAAYRVLTPDGRPAVGADVTLVAKSGEFMVMPFENGRRSGDGSMFRTMGVQEFETISDEDGRFRLTTTAQELQAVVIAHPEGMFETTPAELAREPVVRLERWGRVEGILRVGEKPAANRTVRLFSWCASRERLGTSHSAKTTTDVDGRFVVERAPIGDCRIGPMTYWKNGQGSDFDRGITVRAGETTRIELGGVGRPVVGRITAAAGDDPQIEWREHSHVQMSRKGREPPDELKSQSQEAVRAWYDTYNQTEEARFHRTMPTNYRALISEDRQFRFEDVPAGEYFLHAQFMRKAEKGKCASNDWFRAQRTITVPDSASREAFDVGDLMVEAERRLTLGQAAPDFEVKALDGRTIRLADLRGKVVVVDFWATWCGPCVGELPEVREFHRSIEKDDRVVLISLSSDYAEKDLRSFVAKNDMPWIQAHLDGESKSKINDAYCVRGIPAIFVIDREGRVAAASIRAAQLAQAVSSVLSQTPATAAP